MRPVALTNGRHPDGGELAGGPLLAQGQVDEWLRSASGFGAALIRRDPELGRLVQRALQGLSRADVTVTFGGHFKSGKSTLLNAATGRPLLPVDDLPETGALCILRSGARDQGVLIDRRGGLRTLECTTTAIRRVVSLIGDRGESNEGVLDVDRLELTLRDTTIPHAVRWIDSPGINDTRAMNERARRASDEADVLVWVLSSRQPLAEVEMEFVRQRVSSRGPASVVFLLNAFLPADTVEAWMSFRNRNWPVLLGKVRDHGPCMGFTDRTQPQVVPVAGRPLAVAWRSEFGGGDLRGLLQALSALGCPRVVCSRFGAVATALAEVSRRLEDRLASERRSLEAAKRTRAQAHAAAMALRGAFRRDVDAAYRRLRSAWAAKAKQSGNEVADSIDAENILRDRGYSKRLNDKLKEAAERVVSEFLDEVSAAARKHSQRAVSARSREEVEDLLTPTERCVSVPKTEPDYTAAKATAAIGAGLGLVTFGLAGILGAGAAVPLAVKAESEASAKDASAARSNARSEGEEAAREFDDMQDEIAELIAPTIGTQPDGGEPPDDLLAWEALRDRCSELARRASQLARGGVGT